MDVVIPKVIRGMLLLGLCVLSGCAHAPTNACSACNASGHNCILIQAEGHPDTAACL